MENQYRTAEEIREEADAEATRIYGDAYGQDPAFYAFFRTSYLLSIWYFLIVFFLLSYLQQYFFSAKVETIPYSQIKQYIAEGTLNKLTIGPENIRGTLKVKGKKPGQDQEFTTVRVNDPDLVKDLDERKVSYSGRYENKFLGSLLSWILRNRSQEQVILGISFL